MAGETIPVPLTNWLRSQYPQLNVHPEWLSECVAYLRDNFPHLTPPQLIKEVNAQLLFGDLASITAGPSFPNGIHAIEDSWVARGPREAVLVQVMSVVDIGVSALNLLDVAEARKAERQTMGSASLLASSANDPTRAPATANVSFASGEQEVGYGEGIPPFDDGNKGPPSFPRSMLKLELSDGHTLVPAIEHKRIHGLSMEETKLGEKLLLKNVRVLRGILLLDPSNVVLKGHHVEELEAEREERLINSLRERLGKPLQTMATSAELQATVGTNHASGSALPSPHRPSRPGVEPDGAPDRFPDSDEEEAMMAGLAETERARLRPPLESRRVSPPRRVGSARGAAKKEEQANHPPPSLAGPSHRAPAAAAVTLDRRTTAVAVTDGRKGGEVVDASLEFSDIDVDFLEDIEELEEAPQWKLPRDMPIEIIDDDDNPPRLHQRRHTANGSGGEDEDNEFGDSTSWDVDELFNVEEGGAVNHERKPTTPAAAPPSSSPVPAARRRRVPTRAAAEPIVITSSPES